MNIARLRHVRDEDTHALAGLYKQLDTCNGSVEGAAEVVKDSLASAHGPLENVTLVAELVDSTNLEASQVVATGRLIRIGDAERSTHSLMYRETAEGLELEGASGLMIEFGGLVVDNKYRGYRLSKAITALRAFIARRFTGAFGTSEIVVEFLPDYDDLETKSNAFWRDLILAHLIESGMLSHIKKDCSGLTGRQIQTDEDLLMALLKDLGTVDRNSIVERYFPQSIPADMLTSQVRNVTQNVGQDTVGALVNMRSLYPDLVKAGHFPVDGGSNYTSTTPMGAQGARTVEAAFAQTTPGDEETIKSLRQTAVVLKPINDTRHSLRELEAYVLPGIFTQGSAKLPHQAAELMGLEENGTEVTFIELSRF